MEDDYEIIKLELAAYGVPFDLIDRFEQIIISNKNNNEFNEPFYHPFGGL